MEVRDFIDTQIVPLVVAYQRHGVVDVISILNNSVATSGLWVLDDNDIPHIPNLISIDIIFGIDKVANKSIDTDDYPILSLIAEIPKSFYNNVDNSYASSIISFIQQQIINLFQLITFNIHWEGTVYDPLDLLKNYDWSVRLRYGVQIRPSVTQGGNLGYEVIYNV